MIRVCKGNDTVVVTRGLYEEVYKPLGYKILHKTSVEIREKTKIVDTKTKKNKVVE